MTDRQLTTSAYLTLGLLTSRDWSAYQLAEQVGRGVDHLWPRAARQRYITPKQLLEEGLVTARAEPSGRRTRTIYSITTEGREALALWLSTEARPPALEFEGMIRVLLADEGSIEDLRANLQTMRRQSVAARALFADHAAFIASTGGTFPERQHLFALANRYMIGHYDHIIEWVDWSLEQIASWPDTVTPATDNVAQVAEMLAPSVAAKAADSPAEDETP
ncbi:PadR family transcriptional regulator [Microbacterium sp. P5_E9]